MKIAFVLNNINQLGGVEKVTCLLANYFSDFFHYKVTIYSLYSNESNVLFMISHNVVVKHMGFESKMSKLTSTLKDVKNVLKLIDEDIIISQNSNLSLFCILLKHMIKGKVVVCEHSTNEYYSMKRRLLNYYSYIFADAAVFLTNYQADKIRKYCKNNTIVIPNPLSTTLVQQQHTLENKIIIAAGRLEYIKGFDLLIDSFSLIAKKFPDWKLIIYGEGSMRSLLINQIREKGLENQILLPGAVNNMTQKYLQANIYALSSRDESFGLVLLEAMSLGLPVVSFDIPAVREVSKGEGIIFIENYSVKEFSKSLELLITDVDFRISLANNGYLESKKYSISNICIKWKELFKKLNQ